MSIQIVLTSTIIAAFVAGFVSWRVSERRIAIENITRERAKWRDQVRNYSALVHKAIITVDDNQLSELRSAFRLLLNPHHDEDQYIVNSIVSDERDKESKAIEFSQRVSLLLKHDWERAKYEAHSLRFFRKKPARVSYEEFIKNKNR